MGEAKGSYPIRVEANRVCLTDSDGDVKGSGFDGAEGGSLFSDHFLSRGE